MSKPGQFAGILSPGLLPSWHPFAAEIPINPKGLTQQTEQGPDALAERAPKPAESSASFLAALHAYRS
ncbi:hypothetical protein, partial [uncultured Delftia sp.]|uniref:hypothetical protein n=1 Tax=uncultured Delftia sp. TaxID=191464 RepID=UPI002592611E